MRQWRRCDFCCRCHELPKRPGRRAAKSGYLSNVLATPSGSTEDFVRGGPGALPFAANDVSRLLRRSLCLIWLRSRNCLQRLSVAGQAFATLIVTAAILIPVRIFFCAVLFNAAGHARGKFGKIWWLLLPIWTHFGPRNSLSSAPPYSVRIGVGVHGAARLFAVCATFAHP